MSTAGGRSMTLAGPDPGMPLRPRSSLDVFFLCVSIRLNIAGNTRVIPVVRFQGFYAVTDNPSEFLPAGHRKPLFCYTVPHWDQGRRKPSRDSNRDCRRNVLNCSYGPTTVQCGGGGAAKGIGTAVESIPGKVCRDS